MATLVNLEKVDQGVLPISPDPSRSEEDIRQKRQKTHSTTFVSDQLIR